MKNKIKFPAMDLSFNDKEWINMGDIFFEDDCLHFASSREFRKKYLHHILVDSKGDLYKITGKRDLAIWRKCIPFIKKSIFLFDYVGNEIDLNRIKEYYIKKTRVYDVLDEEYHLDIEERVSRVKKVNSLEAFFKEVLG